MGVACCIQFDNARTGLDLVDLTDGKSVASAIDGLSALAHELGLPPFYYFMGQSMDDLEEMLGMDMGETPMESCWFDPDQGIDCYSRLAEALKTSPERIESSECVIRDLESYVQSLQKAKGTDAKWHMSMFI